MNAAWREEAVEFVTNTPEQYAAIIREEYERAARIIQQAGIKPENKK